MDQRQKLSKLLDQLDLSHREQEILDLEFTKFDQDGNLVGLDIGLMDLTLIPSSIFDDFSKLEMLNLSGNYITSLPEGIFHYLPLLTAIGLNNTKLTTVADDLVDNQDWVEWLSTNNLDLEEKPAWLDDLLEKGVNVSYHNNPFAKS